MPCSSASATKGAKASTIARPVIKKTASAGSGLSKKDADGKPYYSYWTKECCPAEHRQIVYVKVDATANALGSRVSSGAWTYDRIRKHSLERLREIPYYVKFGAQLKFTITESEERRCKLDEKRKPKGTYGADWVEGSDRDGYYRAVMPDWKQERIEADGHSSPEVYHDLQYAAVMAKFQ